MSNSGEHGSSPPYFGGWNQQPGEPGAAAPYSMPQGGQNPYTQPPSPAQPYPAPPGPSSPSFPGSVPPGSQPLYGQFAPASQPMTNQFGYWGPLSQGLAASPPPAQPRKVRQGLWIALALVAVLILVSGAGVAFVVTQIGAPAAAATQFCTVLRAQDYGSAYNVLSSRLRARLTQGEFGQISTLLDQVEGKVTACSPTTGNDAPSYALGSSEAVVTLVLTRAKHGVLQGTLHLKDEQGSWKVDSLDARVLGINLDALQVAQTLCDAVQKQYYSAMWGLFGSSARSELDLTGFVGMATLDDRFDGQVNACSIVNFGQGNTDTTATLTMSVTRTKSGTKSGSLTLGVESDGWKIAAIDSAIRGTDYRAVLTGAQFCDDISRRKFADAYSLFSSGLQQNYSQQAFMKEWDVDGILYSCGDPDISSYQITGDQATYRVDITESAAFNYSRTWHFTFHFLFEGGIWKVDGYDVSG
jgi:hypothetical protein